MIQTVFIAAWHPTMSANGSHGHWRTHQKKHDIDRDMAWASAMHVGWRYVPGRVRLTITLVYGRRYRLDTDNLYARVKGLVDGLKRHGVKAPGGIRPGGWFSDDSTDVLDLVVKAEVDKESVGTRITLEALE